MNKSIKIYGTSIPVTDEVYQEYYKMGRRARYLEEDVKVGISKTDSVTGMTTYTPSREDSIERLLSIGTDFSYGQAIEDMICDKEEHFLLIEALKDLNEEETRLIGDLYWRKLTVREIADKEDISHVAIVKRHKKTLDKLRKHFL